MATPLLLALDVGTQSSRAGLITVDGRVLGIAQIQHGVESPKPGWAQQQPECWWDEICRAVGDVLRETGADRRAIAAVCTCGQMHGPVGLDEEGRVTTDWVQLWCDKRCASQCDAVRADYDESQLAAAAANVLTPAWVALKVRWYKEHQPAAYDRARWFLVPKDFINYRLTGVAATDPSEASGTYLWDCRTDGYSADLAGAVGVDLGRFAPVRASREVIGEVTQGASQRTGIPAGTPVVAGGGDFPVSMLGFGIVGEGIVSDVTGTSTLFAMHTPRPLIHPAVFNLRHVVDGWIPFKLLDSGGLAVKWCRDLVSSARGEEISFDDLIALAEKAPPGSEGLIFYPYLLGERRPENTAARAGFLGVTLNHSAGHFIRAVMEGVALAMGCDLTLFRGLGTQAARFLSVGGGTRNALWNQIKADVVQMPIELSDEPEAGLKGAALLAAAGAGLIADPAATACQRRQDTRVVHPRPAASSAYQQAMQEYVRVYDHLLGFWQANT